MPRYQEQGRSTPGPVQPAHGLGVRNMAPMTPPDQRKGVLPVHLFPTLARPFGIPRGRGCERAKFRPKCQSPEHQPALDLSP